MRGLQLSVPVAILLRPQPEISSACTFSREVELIARERGYEAIYCILVSLYLVPRYISIIFIVLLHY